MHSSTCPSIHPSVLLKLYDLNRVQSSRRLEREAGRNVEMMWLTRRLVPDHKTISDSARITDLRSARSRTVNRMTEAPTQQP